MATNYCYIGRVTNPGDSWFNGKIDDFRFTAAARYSGASFSVPTAAHPTVLGSTKLLLNFANAAIYDNTGKHNVTVVGDTKTIVAQNRYGSSSMFFDGTGDYTTTPATTALTLSSTDFTIELWAYFETMAPTYQGLVDFRSAEASNSQPSLYISSAGLLYWHINLGNAITSTSTALSINTWYHIAVSKVGGFTRMFVNGIQVGSTYTDSNTYAIGSVVTIGRNFDLYPMQGYIDDLRITKGVGRYTGNFQPPQQSLFNK
jgi:hypothetical protein